MTTLTANQAQSGVAPKGNHRGVDAVVSSLVFPTDVISLSAGDVINWGRIAPGSRLLSISRGFSGFAVAIDATETFMLDGVTITGSGTFLQVGSFEHASLPILSSISGDAVGDKDANSQMLQSRVTVVTSGSGVGTLSRTFMVTRDG